MGMDRGEGRDKSDHASSRESELVLISNSIHRRRHATRSKKEVSGGDGVGRARHVVCRIIIAPESSGGGS